MTGPTEPLGILAGGGRIPVEIARAATGAGRKVHIVGLGDDLDDGLSDFPVTRVRWGAVGALLDAFRANGCRDLVIAGRVSRPDLRRISPDLGLLRALPDILRLIEGGDDSVLRKVVRFFEGRGFRVVGIAEVAPNLLIGDGAIGQFAPTADDLAAAAAGFELLAALGSLDVGQAVVMSGRVPLAIEGAEGTDRMLARVHASGSSRAILVKAPKPGQELRVDLPAVGSQTIMGAVQAGLSGVVLAAGRVIAADLTDMRAAADRTGLFVTGVVPAEGAAVARPAGDDTARVGLTTRQPDRRNARDLDLASGIVARLTPWGPRPGAVAVRGYAVAVGVDEDPRDLLARATTLKAWGLGGRRGVAALPGRPTVDLIIAAADAGLAGLSFAEPPEPSARRALGDQAAVSRLFVYHPPEPTS